MEQTAGNAQMQDILTALDKLTLDGFVGALIILIIGVIAIRLIMKLFKKLIMRAPVDKAIVNFLSSGIRIILYLVLATMVADKLGLPVTSLVALLSLFALAISLSVQNVLANVVSGMVILMAKPFTVGDFIEANSASGTVESINLMYTRLLTPDNKVVLVPNSELSAQRITNYSASRLRRVDVVVRVGYEHSNDKVFAALIRAAEKDEQVDVSENKPMAVINSYGENCIEFALRAWTCEDHYWPLYHRLMNSVRTELLKDGIELTSSARRIQIDPK